MQYLKVEKKDCHVEVTLNRPDVHNAFHPEMIAELTLSFVQFSKESDLRCVILKGDGKSFSAGADLQWMKSMLNFSKEENQQDALKLFDMFQVIANCVVPVVASAHGSVMGGGLGLVAACDLVAAEEATQFCFSEVRLGLAPATISPFVLRKAQNGLVREWMLTGQTFSAEEAHAAGLVNFVGNAAAIEKYLKEKLKSFYANGPQAVRATKKLFQIINSGQDPRTLTAQLIAERRVSEEGQEGLKSFLEKRIASWKKNHGGI